MCKFNSINKMDTQIKTNELEAKKMLLNNAVIQLKKEFVGLDGVIDQIASTITAWLYFPELQEKPVIVNLWGLTGIGKTSLVKRLSELLDFSNKYYHFDTNNYRSSYGNQTNFEEINDNCKGESFIVTLDEFQLARTKSEEGKEQNNNSLQNIWDILDNGKFELVKFDREFMWLHFFIERLSRTINAGFEVENGKVKGDYKKFLEYKRAKHNETTDNYRWNSRGAKLEKDVYFNKEILEGKLFITDNEIEKLFGLDNLKIDDSISEIRNKLNKMNATDTIKYLKNIYHSGLKPKIVDCTKALIFVIGNLDEVYTMAKDFNTDISANEFHYLSKRITLPSIKTALLKRFRSEQIARLGNNHIIYPAFSESDFYKIIDLELNKIKVKIKKIYNIKVKFNSNISKLIYKEGVFPTQGCRPVFSTIYEIINARLGMIMTDVFNSKETINTLEFKVSDDAFDNITDSINMEIDLINNKKIISTHIENIKLKLVNLSIPKYDDIQSIAAVHEAGHCVLEIALNKKIPEQVVSVTASANNGGFMHSRTEYGYTTKERMLNNIAIGLGGLLAEEMIFRDKNISGGSESDIEKVTQFATSMLTKQGFGMFPINPEFLPKYDNNLIEKDELLNLISDAKNKARDVLLEQKRLLLHIADYLSDNQSIDRDSIIELTKKYANNLNIDEILADKSNIYYRSHLKALVKEVC